MYQNTSQPTGKVFNNRLRSKIFASKTFVHQHIDTIFFLSVAIYVL